MEASFNPGVLAGGYFLTSPPNPHTPFSSLSKERTSNEWPRVLPENRDPPDGAIHIYILACIIQCESHAFRHIPTVNQLPFGILAGLNSVRFLIETLLFR